MNAGRLPVFTLVALVVALTLGGVPASAGAVAWAPSVEQTAEDKAVPAENSLRFYSALVAHGVPAELHVFPHGRHGIGLGADVPGARQWPQLCSNWLQRLKVIAND